MLNSSIESSQTALQIWPGSGPDLATSGKIWPDLAGCGPDLGQMWQHLATLLISNDKIIHTLPDTGQMRARSVKTCLIFDIFFHKHSTHGPHLAQIWPRSGKNSPTNIWHHAGQIRPRSGPHLANDVCQIWPTSGKVWLVVYATA